MEGLIHGGAYFRNFTVFLRTINDGNQEKNVKALRLELPCRLVKINNLLTSVGWYLKSCYKDQNQQGREEKVDKVPGIGRIPVAKWVNTADKLHMFRFVGAFLNKKHYKAGGQKSHAK